MYVQGLEIRSDTDEAQRLALCLVRRLTGDDEATPDTSPGVLPIRVQAHDDTDVPALAETLRDECADELGIREPWELVSVLRP